MTVTLAPPHDTTAPDPNTTYVSHFGVYGVAIKDNHILLIRKQLGCYTGLLDLPGGTPEPHELLEQTLRREVLEETGCEVVRVEPPTAVSSLHSFISTTTGQHTTLRHLGALFTMVVRGEPQLVIDDVDSAGANWYEIDKLLDYEITPFVKVASSCF